jgi:putative tryptophan/tyrosine transport system substrate-binding protein
MRRREFLGLLGGVAMSPVAADAEQAAKPPVIGLLAAGPTGLDDRRIVAFLQRLQQLGWIEGRNIRLDIRFSDGRRESADEIAAGFAKARVDIVVTGGAVAILAARRAMPTTPIVFAVTADPVGAGLVDSIAHPGGMITGLSSQGADYGGKQIDLLREIAPNLRRLGVIAYAGSPGALAEMRGFATAAKAQDLELAQFEVSTPDDIATAFETMRGRLDALDVVPDPFTQRNKQQFIALALAAKIPAIYGTRENATAGGLMSFGPDLADLYRRAAEFVDKILHGVKPAEIPVEQPTKFELVVNLKTARAMGLVIPEAFLARADEVIE